MTDSFLTRDPSAKLGLSGRFGAWSQFGAVGLIGFLLVMVMSGVGVATYNLVAQQLQRAHDDRAAERQIEREERRLERERGEVFVRELSRVSATLERIDRSQADYATMLDRIARSQTEQANRLAELAKIFERLQKREESPQSCRPLLERLASLAVMTAWFVPGHEVDDPAPSGADVVLPATVPKPAEPPPAAEPGVLTIAVGRFAWAYARREIPVTYHVDGESVAKLDLAKGVPFAGIRFDDPPGARPKAHIPPADAKGKVCALIGSAAGTARLQVWGNPGPGKDPELLATIAIRIVDDRDPPRPMPPAIDPPKPAPTIESSKILAKLRTVYLAIGDRDRKALVTMAAAGMDLAAIAAEDSTIANAGMLESAVAAQQRKVVSDVSRLKPFSPAIAETLLAILPNDSPSTTLTPELRGRLQAAYREIAAAFRQLANE